MANENTLRFYQLGADDDTRKIVDKHRQKINDYVDQVTNQKRADYVHTTPANVAAVYQQMRAEAYAELAEHKQHRIRKADQAIARNRDELKSTTRPSEYQRRTSSLRYRMASDDELRNRVMPIRGANDALALTFSFDSSADLEAYLNELERRPKVKETVAPIVSEAFKRTGAAPTDIDNEAILKTLDRKREVESEGAGEFRITLYEQDGETVKGRMPVKFDSLTDKDKLERLFDLKL